MVDKVTKSEQEWMQQLTPEEFQICRLKGTERPFTGKYNSEKSAGVYKCICCGHPLFDAGTKYESGSGWPSFFAPIGEDAVCHGGRFLAWHASRGGDVRKMRFPPRSRLRRWPSADGFALLYEFRLS